MTWPNKLEGLPWKPFPVGPKNLRARPEPTQSEDLSDASFLGKLLVLPANVRLDWKVIARYKHSSLFGLVFCKEKKSFITLATGSRTSFSSPLTLETNKLVRLFQEKFFLVSQLLAGKAKSLPAPLWLTLN